VIDSGFAPHHLRFYLIYGHYRDRLNLCRDRLHLARGRIDAFRDLAEKIAGAGKSPAKSHHRAERQLQRLQTEFERRMNDDLDVKGAFDAIYEPVEALAKMAAAGGLAVRHRRAAAKVLGKAALPPEIHQIR
jgi:cysteinyl-tRNA synthetase